MRFFYVVCYGSLHCCYGGSLVVCYVGGDVVYLVGYMVMLLRLCRRFVDYDISFFWRDKATLG
jgi:hypothetical protein